MKEKELKEAKKFSQDEINKVLNTPEKIIANHTIEIVKALGFIAEQPYPPSTYNDGVPAWHVNYGDAKKSPDGQQHHTEYSLFYHSSYDWIIPAFILLKDKYEKTFNIEVYNFSIAANVISIWASTAIMAKKLNNIEKTLKEIEDFGDTLFPEQIDLLELLK